MNDRKREGGRALELRKGVQCYGTDGAGKHQNKVEKETAMEKRVYE